jgi:uncharacterized protein
MRLEGITNIKREREVVWEFLIDPDRVCECGPGVKSVEVIEPDKKFRAVAAVGFGSVKATFNTDVEFVEMDKPNRAKLKAHGKAPGSAVDAIAEMKLSDGADGTTDVAWTADVTVVGTIASLASRLMGSVTKKLTNEFFTCMKKNIET